MFAAMLVEMVAAATPTRASSAVSSRAASLAMIGASMPGGGLALVTKASTFMGSQSSAGSTPLRSPCDALVMTTAIALKAIIVVGRPSACPHACSRWPFP